MRAVAARWWATAHRARSEEQEQEHRSRSRSESGCPVPQIAKSNKKNVASRKYAVSSVLGARPRPRPRTGPATCRANWLVGGGAASPSERRKQCMQLCAQTELVAQADACAVLRTWFSRRGRPRGETSREHSRQGPQGVPRDHTAFSISSGFRAPCSPPSVPGAPDTRCLLRRFPVQV